MSGVRRAPEHPNMILLFLNYFTSKKISISCYYLCVCVCFPENATRTCTEDGLWFVNPLTNETWTNLTMCLMPDRPHFPEKLRVSTRHVFSVKVVSSQERPCVCVSRSFCWYVSGLGTTAGGVTTDTTT